MSWRDQDKKIVKRGTACRSCGKWIIWLRTEAGKRMPVDAETVEPMEMYFRKDKHTSHFATCPNADQHRKRGRS